RARSERPPAREPSARDRSRAPGPPRVRLPERSRCRSGPSQGPRRAHPRSSRSDSAPSRYTWATSVCRREVWKCMSTRTTLGIEPSTGISCAQSRGTLPSPIRLAASAGNTDRRSFVAVKNTLTRSAPLAPLRSSIAARSRSVALSTASAESSATRMAPRAARTVISPIAMRATRPMRANRLQAAQRGSQPCGAVEGANLFRRELPDLARLEPAESERSLTDANQTPDGKPHGGEHPPNLALAALADHQTDGAAASRARDRPDLQRSSDAVLELHSAAQPGELAGGGGSLDLGQVFLLHSEARVCQPLRELTVVGEQQQPFGVAIKPPNREHPQIPRKERGEVPGRMPVPGGGRDARRVVEDEIAQAWVHVHHVAIDEHPVAFGVHTVAEDRHAAVHRHPSVPDQLLAGSPGAKPRPRQSPLEALRLHVEGYASVSD